MNFLLPPLTPLSKGPRKRAQLLLKNIRACFISPLGTTSLFMPGVSDDRKSLVQSGAPAAIRAWMSDSEQLRLNKVVFYGRSLAEYELIFNLHRTSLAGKKILDCPGGTASFAAEARPLGADVWCVDPGYALPPSEWERIAAEDIGQTLAEVRRIHHVYRWDYYSNWEQMRAARFEILNRFIEDWRKVRTLGRHVAARLPRLPFRDREFDLVLSGHLLFIYRELLPPDFQILALQELVRVSRGEVRVFPVSQMNREPFPKLDELRRDLKKSGIETEMQKSRGEFAKGWNTLMILRKEHDKQPACS